MTLVFTKRRFLKPFIFLSVFSAVLHFRLVFAAEFKSLLSSSSTRGSTTGVGHLVSVNGFRGGQALFRVAVESDQDSFSEKNKRTFRVTTCSNYTDFDTELYAFRTNPLKPTFSPDNVIDSNDNACGEQSTLELDVSESNFVYILLSGHKAAEGLYELRISGISNYEESVVSWGLDRIDQRSLPLDGQFSVTERGKGVFIYVLDSGIRSTHYDFLDGVGKSRALLGHDVVQRLEEHSDTSGHGTQVAALAIGKKFGVVKQATAISVRVLDRNGAGRISQIIEGLSWAKKDIERRETSSSVIVMSLSTVLSQTLNAVVDEISSSGIAVVTAAGNEGRNCALASPASAKSSITVAASDRNDRASRASNFGDCVTIFAPGVEIVSAWHTGDNSTKTISGTSAACPLVAGAVAILLEQNPKLEPQEIREVLQATATLSVKRNAKELVERSKRQESDNDEELGSLLYVRSIPDFREDKRPPSGKMYLYMILGLFSYHEGLKECPPSQAIESLKSKILEILGTKMGAPTTFVVCCLGSLDEQCNTEDASSGQQMIIRSETRDAHAHSAFIALKEFSENGANFERLSALTATRVTLKAEPWVVDSRGYKYWAAPALRKRSGRHLSTSYVVLIGCCVVILFFLMFFGVWILIRRRRRDRELRSQLAFEEQSERYEKNKEHHINVTASEAETERHRREAWRRENSELPREILAHLSPTRRLPTPSLLNQRDRPTRFATLEIVGPTESKMPNRETRNPGETLDGTGREE